MEMIATSKMRRAQEAGVAGRPYDEKIRQYVTSISAWLEARGVNTGDLDIMGLLDPGRVMRLATAFLNSLRKLLTNGFLVFLTALFMLIEALNLPAKLYTIFNGSAKSLGTFDRFISNVKNYMAIKTSISLAVGVAVAAWLAVMGVNYPSLWGLIAFVLNYVPNIGSILAAVPAILLTFLMFDIFKALIVTIGYLVINVVMGNIIEPKFMGQRLGLSPLVVFLSLLFWGWVLGPVGMLLSVPLP